MLCADLISTSAAKPGAVLFIAPPLIVSGKFDMLRRAVAVLRLITLRSMYERACSYVILTWSIEKQV